MKRELYMSTVLYVLMTTLELNQQIVNRLSKYGTQQAYQYLVLQQSFVSNLNDYCWNHCISLEFIEKYISYVSNFRNLSKNPNITMEFVLRHRDKQWEFFSLSKNPGITLDDIKQNPRLPWKSRAISMRPDLTYEFVKENTDKGFYLDLYLVFAYANIRLKDHKKSSFFIAYLNTYQSNKHITVEDIQDIIDMSVKMCNWEFISKAPNLTMDFIEKYRDKLNMKDVITHCTNLDLEKFIDDKLLIDGMRYSPSLNFKFVEKHIFLLEKYYQSISGFVDMEVHDVKKYSNVKWNYHLLSMNDSLDLYEANSAYLFSNENENVFENCRQRSIEKSKKRIIANIKLVKVMYKELIGVCLHPKRIMNFLSKYSYNIGVNEYQ